jgi:hypothetical protein
MPALLGERPSATAPAGPATGPDQGVIEEARRRQRLRRVRVALGGLLVAAGIAGVAWALVPGGSSADPRHARQPAGAGTARSRALAAGGFNVRLSPALDSGQYGWCVGVEERPGAIAGGGCAATPVSSTPLIMRLSGGSVTTRKQSIVVLSTPRVAAVLVNGRRRVPTVALPGLPYGLRAARILIPLRIETSRAGRRGFAAPPEPALVALDARGRPIPNRVMREPLERPNT